MVLKPKKYCSPQKVFQKSFFFIIIFVHLVTDKIPTLEYFSKYPHFQNRNGYTKFEYID